MTEIEGESEAVIWEAGRGSGNRYIQLKRKCYSTFGDAKKPILCCAIAASTTALISAVSSTHDCLLPSVPPYIPRPSIPYLFYLVSWFSYLLRLSLEDAVSRLLEWE